LCSKPKRIEKSVLKPFPSFSANIFYPRNFVMIKKTFLFFLISSLFFLPVCFENKSFPVCFLNPLPSAIAAENNPNPLTVWPHEKSDLAPDPAIVFGRMDSGLRYILMENQEPRDRVSMHLVVEVGSMNEDNQEQGYAHFLEHMLFNGSKHFKPGELVKFFQSIGMRFGADANAHTGFYKTVYDVLLPDSKKESLEKGFLVLQDYAEGALLLPSETEKEKKIVLAEKRTRDSASYRTYKAVMRFQFPDARISERFPIGLEKTINDANSDKLKIFYDTWYRPENMTIVIAGDFQAETAEKMIKEKFSPIKPRAPSHSDPAFGEIHHAGINPFYHYEKEAGSTSVSISLVKKILAQPDSFHLQKHLLMRKIGARILQNRFEKMLRKPDTPFTEASSSSGIFFRQIDYADISATCSPENWKKTLAKIEKTLRTALLYEFTEVELERVKKEYLAAMDKAVKGASTRKSQMLARQILHNLNNDRVFQSPGQEKKIFSPVIKSFNAKQIHEAFKNTWETETRLITITGNATIETEPEKKISHVFNTSRMVAVAKPDYEKKVIFPYLPDPEQKGKILSRKEIDDLGIICIDFENNLRLNLKKTDFKQNEIMVNLAFGNGRSGEPQDKTGLAILGEPVANSSGLGDLKQDDLERALAGKNTWIRLKIEDDRFELSGSSVSGEIRLMFQLLYAYLNDMKFREDAYQLTMKRFIQAHEKLSHTIEGGMELSGKRFLAGGDHRFGLPAIDLLQKISLEDIRSWIRTPLANSPIEVSVVGDFEPEEVIALAATYMGSLPFRKNTEADNKESELPKFPNSRTHEISVPTVINKAIIDVAYPTEDFWNIPQTRRLVILGEVFSERLRENIREKLGASYTTYAYNRSSRTYKGYGLFQAIAMVDPAENKSVIREIKKISSDMIAGGITADEMKRALDPVVTSLKDLKRTNRYWLSSVLIGLKKYPQQLDWCRTIMQDYESINEKELKSLAEKFLDNQKAAIIVIKPKQKD